MPTIPLSSLTLNEGFNFNITTPSLSMNTPPPIASPSPGMANMAISLKHTAFVLPLTLLFYLYNMRSRSAPTVTISNGILKGISSKSRDDNPFFEFLGIPYALPPIGDLRFEPPRPPRSWEGIRLADDYGPKCVQIEFFTSKLLGQEDCLYLNVFTPKLPDVGNGESSDFKLMPVMVFIHGGYFMSGGSNSYRPEYFMENGLNVVMVTINYRVASLGFLNTGDEVVRGNMGLKDQNMALQWVQANIHHFGGDKTKVTIFGCSAGASSVHYHTVSPMSKGLFAKAITQSGSAIKPRSFMARPKDQALLLGERLNCPTNDSISLISCLKAIDSNRIIMTHRDYLNVLLDPLATYAPSVEAVSDENSFLTKHPYEMLTNGEQHDVPLMSGLNSDEGLLLTARILKNKVLIDEIDEDWENSAPKLLAYDEHPNKSEITAQVKKFYLGDQPLIGFLWSFQNFTDMVSDRLYFTASREAARLHAKKSPVYMYYYTYPAQFSFSNVLSFSGKLPAILELIFNLATKWVDHTILGKNSTRLGICHGDEMLLLFDMGYVFDVKPGDTDYKMSQEMVKLWTDFASSPYSSELNFQDQQWLPSTSSSSRSSDYEANSFNYLKIDSKAEIIEEPFALRTNFWKTIGLIS